MKKIFMFAVTVFGFLNLPEQAFAQEKEKDKESIRVLIDGRPAPIDEVNCLPAGTIQQMHYLHGRDAINLMGPAGAGGVLLVKTKGKKEGQEPIVLKEGKRVPWGSSENGSFSRIHIHVIRGDEQARNLYGPGATGGVLLVQVEKEKETERK